MPRLKAVDAYIQKSQPFAQPILKHLRDLVHEAVPHAEEAIKWGMPCFVSHGAVIANMAAFKEHAAFGFWKAALLSDPQGVLVAREQSSAGHLGRLASVKDLPPDKAVRALLAQADSLNEKGVKVARKPKVPPKKLVVPAYFKQALAKKKGAAEKFAELAPGQQREYVDWLTDAKSEETRERRMADAVQWISEGKSRLWKYQRK